MPDNSYVLYANRPEWKDVVPIPQDEGPVPLAPILYNAQYKDCTDYFRAVYQARERSNRVLELTLQIIRLNPAHYTVWQYRYDTLLELRSSLQAELSLLSTLLPTHLKSYQAWNHRRLLLLQLGKGSAKPELAFTEIALRKDAKNYHTWAYRQWILCNFFSPQTAGEAKIQEEELDKDDGKVWAAEEEWTANMLDEDIRNNSVWHHRFFVLWEGPAGKISPALVERELDFVKRKVALAPNNGSVWNYMRGKVDTMLLDRSQTPYSSLISFARPYTLPQSLQSIASLESNNSDADYLPSKRAELPCTLALEFVADCHEADEAQSAAEEMFDRLIKQDPIRKRYWEYRKRNMQKAVTAVAA